MNTTISENPIKLKYKILTGIFLLLILSVSYYYIYHSNSYLEAHSRKLSYAGESDKCEKNFICNNGYYEVSYPTSKKIFHYAYRDLIFSNFASFTTFLNDADPKTFRAIGREYAVDKNNFYYTSQTVKEPNINLNSLTVVGDFDFYAQDNASVFFRGEKLQGANPVDFRLLDKQSRDSIGDSLFAISNGKIFNGSTQVKVVRDGKFLINPRKNNPNLPCKNQQQSESNSYLCDITEFGEDEAVDIDITSFQVLNHEFSNYDTYAKDKNNVYYCGKRIGCTKIHIVDGADPKTFRSDPPDGYYYKALDDNEVYSSGCKLYGMLPQTVIRGSGLGGGIEHGYCTYLLEF